MDSAGNEVIIVDDRAQTNGFNGNYSEESVSEMKTRSKAITSGGPGEAAKLRSSSRTNAAPSSVANSHDKTTTGSATSAPTSAPAAASVISSTGSSSADKDKKMNLRSGATDSATESASGSSGKSVSSASSGSETASKSRSAAVESTPGPKSSKKGAGSVGGGDREDDSGINSRSSSISTDDTYSSRLRTRSKRTEALSSSTPASTRKASTRMPLSTYDFDDDSIILEEEPSTSATSLKRKATKVLVEEMEDDEESAADDEPPVKVTVIRRTSFFNVLLNPLKAIRGKIFVGSQQPSEKDNAPVSSAATDEAASQTNVFKVNDDDPKTEHAASLTDLHNSEAATTAATNEDGKETPGTCMLM